MTVTKNQLYRNMLTQYTEKQLFQPEINYDNKGVTEQKELYGNN